MNLSVLASRTDGNLTGVDVPISGVSIDTRTLCAGDTFIALVGPNFDGHEFVLQAEEAGAQACVVSRKIEGAKKSVLLVNDTYDALNALARICRENYSGCVAAITGSCGKTTIKGMLQSICEQAGRCVATKGNLNNLIGVPLTLVRLNNTFDYAVVEAGTSVVGEIPALAGLIQPDVALVSNIMPAHVEGFGSVENIAKEKVALYQALNKEGVAVLNLDDDFVDYFKSETKAGKKIGFTLQGNVSGVEGVDETIGVSIVEHDNAGSPTICLKIEKNDYLLTLGVLGEHNVANAAAAAAVARAMNIGAAEIVEGLKQFSGEKRRMQLFKGAHGESVVDDSYNANPGSVKAAIDYLSEYEDSILVMGDMAELGSSAETEHKKIGDYAREAGIRSLFATGVLANEAVSAFGVNAVWCESQAELLEKLVSRIKKNSVVLVKGSRSARMEIIADALRAAGEKQ